MTIVNGYISVDVGCHADVAIPTEKCTLSSWCVDVTVWLLKPANGQMDPLESLL